MSWGPCNLAGWRSGQTRYRRCLSKSGVLLARIVNGGSCFARCSLSRVVGRSVFNRARSCGRWLGCSHGARPAGVVRVGWPIVFCDPRKLIRDDRGLIDTSESDEC